ncbi:PaaX family transcriptional regulator C-terminal domain-containing protein [Limobrevibacterium gyesilva]|uniref:Phenylacetic acid degradation operon negative regulatory protein PaaX n=1 Tax=Limobrevibacterium gyesilva TaxID=2991712 RepID=A0AA41YUZ5_9PROT|nr:PaaX family transcriptional regulator C-terminal domain-containing protein [Limobrevibacterium gyesilva]MCW3476965.1 phenylacetic acid degradation operon negative regulatory protein PaaX [Limobrevibacterium gyesilva]
MLPAILARLREQPSRTGSLIITLYGDAIAPRGGSLWLGTLLEIFRAIGVGGGVVRTAVSRLAADGWLARNRVGRNSFYHLAERGRDATEAATPRIYGRLSPGWGGRFRLALVDPGPARQALAESGYGTVLPGLLVAPDTAPAPQNGLVLSADAEPEAARALAARAWPLDDVAGRYRQFIAAFPDAPGPMTDRDALLARMLLIHEYRRVVLRDPHLPAVILPPDWPGHAARALCARLYAALLPGSERWLDANAVAEDGKLPPPDPALLRRFA